MRLWLVRHARPLVNAGVCYGASDVPADARHTRACAQALAQALPPDIRVLTSPLRRCLQLAEALRALRPGLTPVADHRLAEMDFGCWEGWRWDDIPRAAFDPWTADFCNWRFGGRESVQELLQRVAAVWHETAQDHEQAVWITHAGVIRAATLLARGRTRIERADQWPVEAPDCGRWTCLPFPAA